MRRAWLIGLNQLGQYTDPETGLIYLRARYYDPTTGQFLTRDSLEELTRQPYSYAGDDPLNNIDPTGLDWVDDVGNFAAGFGDTVTRPLGWVGLPTTQSIRQDLGWDNVDYCSGWYTGGEVTGALYPVGAAVKGLRKLYVFAALRPRDCLRP